VPGDRSTLARSLSLCVLRTPSMAGPLCAVLAWPRHGATLASFPCTARSSFPSTRVGSRFSPLFTYRTLLLSLVSFCRRVARTPPCPANLAPSFLFSPTPARTGSAPWRCCSPPHVPLVIPLHAASVFGAMRHHLHPPGYKCHLAYLSFIPPPDRE
jgi:hypothetical protein